MKIVVVHGEDEVAARSRYSQIIQGVKKKNWEVVSLKPTDNFSLAERLTSSSLFPTDILFNIDELKKVPISELKWLSKNVDKYEGSLLFYSKGNVPVTIKNALPKNTKFEKFDEPVIIFAFLESFYPTNSKKCLELFEKLVDESGTELVVAMLARHLRDMYWVLEGGAGMSIPDWRMGKIKSQAVKFTKEKLRNTISALANIDIESKTSSADAKFLLEVLIVESLG